MTELSEKREELICVIGELDDFVTRFEKAREGEKVAVERLAERDQEVFELEGMHSKLQADHEHIVLVLQEQVEQLRLQRVEDAASCEALKGNINALRKALQEAQASLGEKNIEIARLREELLSQQEEAQELIDKVADERDQKSAEVSDLLKKLEEFVELMEGIRKSEEEALQRSASAERALDEAQDELKRLRARQAKQWEAFGGMSGANAPRASLDEARNLQEHVKKNKSLQLCVKLLMDALLKNQGTFAAASEELEDVCGTLSSLQEE
ncbi:putative myosin heavy chain [Trypanosoma rangeli]|uniref:Putative myosin heavy chain n=1 Tax=Trypanosoma rangeli TaxID=5698 RepID=A0A3R7R5E2_TRYRA|nr:putative myosin heavy chain [Trypanosoma rangeli]RNE96279.1 putative myosin heavy chain [Trypanosoma rangeli]|eukprot:RNE96279.1 putative myosin heavy chain [Trypanosoma rangeli]